MTPRNSTDVSDDALRGTYYVRIAAAYLRGHYPQLEGGDDLTILRHAVENGDSLNRFKRTIELTRVRSVLGVLQQLRPGSLLDVGPGRGTSLWPIIDTFPSIHITCLERAEAESGMLVAFAQGWGGSFRLEEGDIVTWRSSRTFDVVTILEVLEHVDHPALAIENCLRAADRAVIASVPAHPDDNPEHLHLFTSAQLNRLFAESGAARVKVRQVRDHLLVLALCEG
jgi:trans-aconitate methyltransferase